MNNTITIDVEAKIKDGKKLMHVRFWVGTKLIQLAAFIMRTEIEVGIVQNEK